MACTVVGERRWGARRRREDGFQISLLLLALESEL